ncbi:MAG: 4-aminobutyrate--2-oxoglutarate transaminase [Candidatus Eremiobacteraeota bacterium]|nr:4-aminobutyrate--2-oxoglutarate transaminase [Candidatus Eremiobacteraeota bacterium]
MVSENLRSRRDRSIARGVSTAHDISVERASGARVWDSEGREYYDFIGGIGTLNVGHAHPKIVRAIAEQAERFTHVCFQVAMYEPYVAVAERLNELAPGSSPKKTLLLTTGAEATENAVKIARQYTGRPGVVSFHHGYHGRTLLALSMTGKNAPYKQHFGPYCAEVYQTPFPYEHHGWTTERALAELRTLFDTTVPADQVAAIIIEPVLGEGGFVPAPVAFLQELRRLTETLGIVLICDEIQTGFGRTGTFFASELYDIEPDIITVAKSLAGGIPLAAVIGKAEIMDAPAPGGLGGTFAGNPVACAAALATLDIMDHAFFARANEIGKRLRSTLRSLQSRFIEMTDVRGLGAMLAAEIACGPNGENLAEAIVDESRSRGLLLLLAGKRNVIRILVPLVIDDEELDEALSRLVASCEAVFSR